MTRAEAIEVLEKMKYPQKVNKNGFIISNVNIENEALEMAISDMTALSKIRAKLNTAYNNTSEDAQLGLSIALDILDRYTKGEAE